VCSPACTIRRWVGRSGGSLGSSSHSGGGILQLGGKGVVGDEELVDESLRPFGNEETLVVKPVEGGGGRSFVGLGERGHPCDPW
jgi:hypothetical protein